MRTTGTSNMNKSKINSSTAIRLEQEKLEKLKIKQVTDNIII